MYHFAFKAEHVVEDHKTWDWRLYNRGSKPRHVTFGDDLSLSPQMCNTEPIELEVE
jgi:hypothetical protein